MQIRPRIRIQRKKLCRFPIFSIFFDESDEKVNFNDKSLPRHCFGAIRDGVFDGQINTDEGTYYVERANKYFPDLTNDTFHSVIYHEKHLKDPLHHSRAGKKLFAQFSAVLVSQCFNYTMYDI